MTSLTVILLLCALFGFGFLRRALRRRIFGTKSTTLEPQHCVCGYPLTKLNLPRCPECGRVIGFNATPEQLGLTEENLKRMQAARERRLREQVNSAES